MGLLLCPCCGSPTLAELNSYEICTECWWEDEPLDPGELNCKGITLQEAQDNYTRYGAADPHGYWCKFNKELTE